MIQCCRHAGYPEWDQAVGVPSAAGIDYLIGQARHRGHGISAAAIAAFAVIVIGLYPDVDVIVPVPQKGNRASCRALEKAGFGLPGEPNWRPATPVTLA